LTLKTALISLQSLLYDPCPNDPQDAQVARHYLSDRPGFEQTARQWTQMHAGGNPDDKVDPEKIRRLMDMGFAKAKVTYLKLMQTRIERL
jgi:ubiquitin-conjugating enzyme (huntingtin interacting protein 2)